jgi:excisionase family DNA binding protein
MAESDPGAPPPSLSIGDAARLLGVSIRTVRRWEAQGRIRAVRTGGGHRRFPVAEVVQMQRTRRQQAGDASGTRLREANLPDRSLPVLERLLAARSDAILVRTGRHVYSEQRLGWFRSAAAAAELKTFTDELASAAKSGNWERVAPATSMLLARAARAEDGPSYEESFLFLRTLRAVLAVEASVHDPTAPAAISKLFDAVEQEAARNAERFFQADAPERPSPALQERRRAIRVPPAAVKAAQTICNELAALPDCAGVLVLTGSPDSDRLEVTASAGVTVAADPWMRISDDTLSKALVAEDPSFVLSTSSVRLLPIDPLPQRCLPAVACGQVPDRHRVSTVMLFEPSIDVEDTVLTGLADLNARLTALLGGSTSDADLGREVARLKGNLGESRAVFHYSGSATRSSASGTDSTIVATTSMPANIKTERIG